VIADDDRHLAFLAAFIPSGCHNRKPSSAWPVVCAMTSATVAQFITCQRRFAQAVGQDQQAFGSCAPERIENRDASATAWLAGKVHGVVVQMTICTGSSIEFKSNRCARSARSATAKPTVNRRRGFVLVFDLGFGQCRTAIDAPMHRFRALI